MTRPRLLLATLLLLAVLTGWWSLQLDESRNRRRPARGEPDYTIEAFVRLRMGADGLPAEMLRAPLLVHYADGGGAELVRPEMRLYTSAGLPWELKSERAWVDEAQEVVLLYGEVEGWRLDASGARQSELHTRDLRILRSTSYAETDAAARLRSGQTESRGVGLRADLARDRLELLADVRTLHHPAPRGDFNKD